MNKINLEEYSYSLPQNRIANYPLERRDQSKLLIYKEGIVQENTFENIYKYVPENSLLIFNNTKVFPARIIFEKKTGAKIELFCLEPNASNNDFLSALNKTSNCSWKCIVGNVEKWKNNDLIKEFIYQSKTYVLRIKKLKQVGDTYIIEFSWNSDKITFEHILELEGQTPLPPYINRKVEEADKTTYQTIYAKHKGSVAAPTAGLHFTEYVINNLYKKSIQYDYITLHVGAGTFAPVKTKNISEHVMHTEQISVNYKTILNILNNIDNKIIAVGTTSARTIESVYYIGAKLLLELNSVNITNINQWDAYDSKYSDINIKDSLEAVLNYMNNNNIETLYGSTQLMIMPSYKFKIIKGLISNFHQPKSTLLLLISAFIGDKWKEVYDYALKNDFRFLSYGDCCLFLPAM